MAQAAPPRIAAIAQDKVAGLNGKALKILPAALVRQLEIGEAGLGGILAGVQPPHRAVGARRADRGGIHHVDAPPIRQHGTNASPGRQHGATNLPKPVGRPAQTLQDRHIE